MRAQLGHRGHRHARGADAGVVELIGAQYLLLEIADELAVGVGAVAVVATPAKYFCSTNSLGGALDGKSTCK